MSLVGQPHSRDNGFPPATQFYDLSCVCLIYYFLSCTSTPLQPWPCCAAHSAMFLVAWKNVILAKALNLDHIRSNQIFLRIQQMDHFFPLMPSETSRVTPTREAAAQRCEASPCARRAVNPTPRTTQPPNTLSVPLTEGVPAWVCCPEVTLLPLGRGTR